MLRRKNDQKKKVKQAFIDGDVSTKLLTKIIKLAPSFFFLEICDICKNDELTKIITNSKQTYASLITKNENTDIVIVANNDFFNISVNLLFKSLCETIVIYFPFENITFQQFLYNCEPYSNNPQKSAIIKGLCYMICTWVTNENRLYFHFDNFKSIETFEKIKTLI